MTSTGARPAPLRATRMPSLVGVDRGAGLREHVERGLQQFRPRALQQHVAAGHRDRHRVGAGLDPVGQHAVARAREPRHALDHDARGAGAGDLRAHLDRGSRRRRRSPARARRSRSRSCRSRASPPSCATWVPPTVTFGKHDLGAAQARSARAPSRSRPRSRSSAPSRSSAMMQEVDRPRADGAAARHRDARLAHAGDQRRDHPEARAHARDQLVGRGGVDDAAWRRSAGSGPGTALSPARLPRDRDVDAVVAEDALQQRRRRQAAARSRGSASRR